MQELRVQPQWHLSTCTHMKKDTTVCYFHGSRPWWKAGVDSECVGQSLDACACMHECINLPLRECTQESAWAQEYRCSSMNILMNPWTHTNMHSNLCPSVHMYEWACMYYSCMRCIWGCLEPYTGLCKSSDACVCTLKWTCVCSRVHLYRHDQSCMCNLLFSSVNTWEWW